MTDKTLPDSESVRQLVTEMCERASEIKDRFDASYLLAAARALESQSDRITKLEEALNRIVNMPLFSAGYPTSAHDARTIAARALTEGK